LVNHRECHIGGDFPLIYQIDGDKLNFARAGSHAGLFDDEWESDRPHGLE
jgi:mRNA interferase YafQ